MISMTRSIQSGNGQVIAGTSREKAEVLRDCGHDGATLGSKKSAIIDGRRCEIFKKLLDECSDTIKASCTALSTPALTGLETPCSQPRSSNNLRGLNQVLCRS